MSSRHAYKDPDSGIVIPFPAARMRKMESSFDGEADIYSPDTRFLPGWWIFPSMMLSLAFCGWAAFQFL
jgi:hypothetical protein